LRCRGVIERSNVDRWEVLHIGESCGAFGARRPAVEMWESRPGSSERSGLSGHGIAVWDVVRAVSCTPDAVDPCGTLWGWRSAVETWHSHLGLPAVWTIRVRVGRLGGCEGGGLQARHG
jgi:hypothetical protein